MKNIKLLLSFIFLFAIVVANGQTKLDFIEPRPDGYFYQNQKMKKKELSSILESDAEAFDYYKQYKNNRDIGRVIGGTGLLIGTYRFIRLVRTEGQDAGIWFGRFKFSGLTCMIIGSAFYGISVKRFRKSVNIYNNNLKKEHGLGAKDLELNFGLADHGVGVSLNF